MWIAVLQRTWSVARKESLHIQRDSQTLFFMLFVPVVEMFMLGYANDMNVRNVRTAVLDQAGTQESRRLLQQFESSNVARIVEVVSTEADLTESIVDGRARLGIKIPADYSRRLEGGETAQFLVLVDGSIASVAAEGVNIGNALALRESLLRVLGERPLPIEARPRVLFNPDTRSANFFIPGLLVVLCQLMATQLSATSIVREKEQGTLEQLFMTPVRRLELIVGKLLPYLGAIMLEFCGITVLMVVVFRVPIHGDFLTLLTIMFPFVLIMLGTGLWISTLAETKEAAGQMMMATILPSIFLSGYVLPYDSMPAFFRGVGKLIPTTWMIDASRGVILRGAGWRELWPHYVILWTMAIVVVTASTLRMRKRIGGG
jgi:ABC-2 type transport system permease protein